MEYAAPNKPITSAQMSKCVIYAGAQLPSEHGWQILSSEIHKKWLRIMHEQYLSLQDMGGKRNTLEIGF